MKFDMSDHHKDTSVEVMYRHEQHNQRRFDQLNGLLTASSGAVWNYLLAVNGGAAAGMLAFIGAKKELASQSWPYIVLAVFVVGLVLVGVAHAVMVHKVQALITNWNNNIVRYWNNEIGWMYHLEQDQAVVKRLAWLPWALGWASLGLFVLGVVLAAQNWRLVAEMP